MALNNLQKYIIIGGISALIDVILFAIFYDFMRRSLFLSNAISVSAAALFSFSINSFYNFKKSDYLMLRLVSFIAVITAGYFVGILVILCLMKIVGLPGLYSKLISLPFVFFFQYFLNSRVSFR
ncbi:GtrA family protein [Gammaproteobacteria bacterium]|nr:GtrA family protein [Gammaproteobacteria bacterium]MDA9800513.1 GtrA family protein [Gammaproteobacteria bacterium]